MDDVVILHATGGCGPYGDHFILSVIERRVVLKRPNPGRNHTAHITRVFFFRKGTRHRMTVAHYVLNYVLIFRFCS